MREADQTPNSDDTLQLSSQRGQQQLLKGSILKDIIFESWIIMFENCQVRTTFISFGETDIKMSFLAGDA